METLVDDVGSFPLPAKVDSKLFGKAYRTARKAMIEGKHHEIDEFVVKNFRAVIMDSFMKKVETGLDVVNYPQHYDMVGQLADAVRDSMNEGTYLIRQESAVLPEVSVICDEAKRVYERTGKKVNLKVCIIGPVELYLRELGSVVHRDILEMFAENVKRFATNSILNSKYVQTIAVSLDEPSFGFEELSADRQMIRDALEKAFGFIGPTKQIHIHSPSKIPELLDVENLDVLSIEYAASPRNIEGVSKSMLDQGDKQIRVGVARTDINSIVAELYGKGIMNPNAEQLVEDERIMRRRFEIVKEKYGERLSFTGPDCGLGGWPTQESAQLLLNRTVRAVKATGNKP
jgi:5-methyltetrahydropteroyltriglutamate--homocysteine methyltransferase